MSYEEEQLMMIESVTTFLISDNIDNLAAVILDGKEPSQLADLLEFMGNIDIDLYLTEREALIRIGLMSKDLWVRHGALRGASYLDNRNLIDDVRQLIESEQSNMVKNYAERILFNWEREIQ